MHTENSQGTLFQYTIRVNIPCYHVCTGLNPKNLFETLKSYFYNFVVHVPLNIFITQIYIFLLTRFHSQPGECQQLNIDYLFRGRATAGAYTTSHTPCALHAAKIWLQHLTACLNHPQDLTDRWKLKALIPRKGVVSSPQPLAPPPHHHHHHHQTGGARGEETADILMRYEWQCQFCLLCKQNMP